MSVKHRFQSAVIDAGDPDLVGPDEWNDTHELDPRNIAAIFEECFFAGTAAIYAGGVAQSASGTSAATSDGAGEVTGPSLGAEGTGVHHPGVIQASTGTTATGRCGLMTNQGLGTGKIVLYGGGVRFGACLRLGAVSSGTQRYAVFSGFNQSATAASNDALFFRYTDNVNGGRWQCVARKAGVETAVDSGVAGQSSDYTTLEIIVADDASEAEFFIDGASVATIALANLPTTVALSLMPVNIIKSIGNTARSLVIDAYWYEFKIRSR